MTRVQDIMTPSPKTARGSDTVVDVLAIMQREDCGAVPIIEQDQALQGIITDRDIALGFLKHADQSPKQVTVQQLMPARPRLVTVTPDTDVDEAMRLMQEHQVRRLPVCDEDGQCVGIVSMGDVALQHDDEVEVADTLKEVSQST